MNSPRATLRPPAHAFTADDYRVVHEARQVLRPLGVKLVIETDHDAYPEAIAVLAWEDQANASFIVWKARAGWRIEDQRGDLSDTAIGGNWAAADALAWITEAVRRDRKADAGPASVALGTVHEARQPWKDEGSKPA